MILHDFEKAKRDLQKRRSKKELLELTIEEGEVKRSTLQKLQTFQCEARVILQETAAQTQKNLRYHISSLVTMAIQAIFGEGLEFKMAIEQRRNQTEIDFFVEEFGNLQEPLDSNGFGLVDIISLALRVSYWSLKKNRKTFILDEPFRNLSRDHSRAASKLLKTLCEKLGLQIIIVSHDTEITSYADKVFQVEKVGKRSVVSVVGSVA